MAFAYSSDNKRYHTLAYHNRMAFGGRVFKAGLDAGLTCPNRDGTCGVGGCIYCEGNSFSFAPPGSIHRQLTLESERIARKYPDARLNAYFQNGTNTYAPVERLKKLWQEALDFPNVVAVSVATRADCLGEDVLDALSALAEKTALTVELGLQTIHDDTARAINRGYDFSVFLRGFEALRARNIRTCVHMITGLPGEDEGKILESARTLGLLRPEGVKLHLLYVTMETPLEKLWRQGHYTPLERDAYIRLTAEQLRYFPPETVIERLTGDGDKTRLLAPMWSTDKLAVLGGIDKYMAQKDIYQGDLYPG